MHFFDNLLNGIERMRWRVKDCPLRENHGKGEGHEGQVDFEKLRIEDNGFGYRDMRGINGGLKNKYYVCLKCGYLYLC